MNNFYYKLREAFRAYDCCMYDGYEITLTPKHHLNFCSILYYHLPFKIEIFISELDDFLKANPCPYNNMTLKLKILRNDQFRIERLQENIVIKDFNKNVIIDLIMKDVNKESIIHIIDIGLQFL